MNNLKKKDFLDNTEFPELAKKVLKQLPDRWTNIAKYPNNYIPADSGVAGFIYYDETIEFALDNYELIVEAVRRIEGEDGQLHKPEFYDDKLTYYNWLAWFALETVIGEIIRLKE